MNQARAVIYRGSLVLIPIVVACVLPTFGRSWYFVSQGGMSPASGIGHCVGELANTLQDGGLSIIALFVVANTLSVGVLIATCLVLSLYWNARRVYCVLAFGIASAVVVWIGTSPYMTSIRTGQVPFDHEGLSWSSQIFQYHLSALFGIPVGAIISVLPIFEPGRRYWIARGHCPCCHYDLGGSIIDGCPECGWGRAQNAA